MNYGSPVEPCPACEDGLIHPTNETATEWLCDHCGYYQVDELEDDDSLMLVAVLCTIFFILGVIMGWVL